MQYEKIFNLSKKFNFKIIEDASHAFGSKYLNNHVGNCKFSHATVFSFHPVKIFTTGKVVQLQRMTKKLT